MLVLGGWVFVLAAVDGQKSSWKLLLPLGGWQFSISEGRLLIEGGVVGLENKELLDDLDVLPVDSLAEYLLIVLLFEHPIILLPN